jgi:hypothetical protein
VSFFLTGGEASIKEMFYGEPMFKIDLSLHFSDRSVIDGVDPGGLQSGVSMEFYE